MTSVSEAGSLSRWQTAFVTGQSWQRKQWQRSSVSPRKWNDFPSRWLPARTFAIFTQLCTFWRRGLIFQKQCSVTQHIAVTKRRSAALYYDQQGAADFFDVSPEFRVGYQPRTRADPQTPQDRRTTQSRRSRGKKKNWVDLPNRNHQQGRGMSSPLPTQHPSEEATILLQSVRIINCTVYTYRGTHDLGQISTLIMSPPCGAYVLIERPCDQYNFQ